MRGRASALAASGHWTCACASRGSPYPAKYWAKGRFAYVINLWGSSAAYVLGALVLGYSIGRTGSRHARVCLHTEDVPQHFLALLAKVWECRLVEHVKSTPTLSVGEPRFEKVFTKLRGMSLTDFEKILVLDIDMLVRSNVDELFELTPPAAMKRGMNNGKWPYKHGDTIDARCFFQGKDSDGSGWSWGVGGGINAGTMLWQPDTTVLKMMLEELCEDNHPSHICGAGPEQDYLSRYWADAPWSHIGVEYNFQLHQMFFAIHPDVAERAERVALLQTPEKIKIVHYSGSDKAKPWARVLEPGHGPRSGQTGAGTPSTLRSLRRRCRATGCGSSGTPTASRGTSGSGTAPACTSGTGRSTAGPPVPWRAVRRSS